MSAVITDPEKIDLLRRALKHITEHPDEWDQSYWAMRRDCGTTCCLAGHIVLLDGWVLDYPPPRPGYAETATCKRPDDEQTMFIDQVAAQAIGLAAYGVDAEALFEGTQTLDDLWLLAAKLTGGAITRPEVTA